LAATATPRAATAPEIYAAPPPAPSTDRELDRRHSGLPPVPQRRSLGCDCTMISSYSGAALQGCCNRSSLGQCADWPTARQVEPHRVAPAPAPATSGEHLGSDLGDFDHHVCRYVRPARGDADRAGVGCLIEAIGFSLVGRRIQCCSRQRARRTAPIRFPRATGADPRTHLIPSAARLRREPRAQICRPPRAPSWHLPGGTGRSGHRGKAVRARLP
jgi:hypothetical protein